MDGLSFEISYDIDFGPILKLAERISESLRDELARIVEAGGQQLEAAWIEEAGALLKNPTGYIRHIQEGIEYPFEQDPLHFAIINDHPAARLLEEGVKPYDLKKILETSSKVRISKDGNRYLVIPFTQSMASVKAAGIDPKKVRALEPSTFRRGQFPRGSLAHQANPGGQPHRYTWGESLNDMGDVGKRRKYFTPFQTRSGNREDTVDYTWKTSPFERMYRFGLTSGNQLTTFRTMSDKSDPNSWQHPGIRGMKIAEIAVKRVGPGIISEVERITSQIMDKFDSEKS